MQLFSLDKHGSQARAPNDDVAQHGGLTRVNTKSWSLCLQRVSFVLNIHAMVHWHLSKQGIRWLVSCDHIVGSGFELSLPLTKHWFFDWIAGSCLISWSKYEFFFYKHVFHWFWFMGSWCSPTLFEINTKGQSSYWYTENLNEKLKHSIQILAYRGIV